MASHVPEPQSGRETRLLVLVVGVAVVVLLLLARWRYPYSDMSVVTPSSAPLAGLAARATFDEMSGALSDVVGRVSPLTVVVPLAADSDVKTRSREAPAVDEVGDDEEPMPEAEAWGLAVRVRGDLALMYVPPAMMPIRDGESVIDVVAHDPEREIALLRVPPAAGTAGLDLLPASVRTFPGFTFAAALSATSIGPTVQPVFLGRAESLVDPRWSHGVLPASVGSQLTPGTVLFSLNSRFIGLVVGAEDPIIVPAPAIETLMQAMETPGSAPQ